MSQKDLKYKILKKTKQVLKKTQMPHLLKYKIV